MDNYLFIIEQQRWLPAPMRLGNPHPFSPAFRDAQARAAWDAMAPAIGQARRDFNAAFCGI